MAHGWVVLLCMVLVGCSGTAPRIREAPEQPQRCVYVPRREGAAGARKEAVPSAHAGMRVVLVAAAAGASPAAALAPRSAPSLEGLSGEGLGDGVPQGGLRLVPEGGLAAEAGTGGAAGEMVVVGGAVVAAVGGEYSTQAPPGAAPKPEPDKSDKKRLRRIYAHLHKAQQDNPTLLRRADQHGQ